MLRSINVLLVCLMVVSVFSLYSPTLAYSYCGDSNGNVVVNVADLVYLINYCFLNGPSPWDIDTAEVDGYEFINIRDIVYLRNYLFAEGPAPICPATNPEYQSNLELADTIRIPPTTLSAGESLISVPIYYKNSKPIRGIALPLKVNVGEQIPYIDSIVLGARIPNTVDHITIDNITGTVNSGFAWFVSSDTLLLPGSGILYTLYLSVDPEPINRRVLIDTLRLAPSNSPMFIEPNTDGDMPFFVGLRPDSIPFASAVNYGAGDGPRSVFCADLDRDGYLDLAVANWSSDNVSILNNYSDGTFPTKIDYVAGDGPISVFCADFDGDGYLDLAVLNNNSTNVSIFKNNRDGGFESPVNYGVVSQPVSVFCADLDGDGDLDLAVVNLGSNNVSILKNNGDGTFQTKADYGTGPNPRSVFCADLDGDFDLDLAVANYGSSNVSILKNNGDGTFQTAVNYGTGQWSQAVFCADLDEDGALDLAVANYGGNNVSILKNNGNGTFQTAVNYGAGDAPYSVFCADLDGDTDLDLAVANGYGDNVSILKNNGNGTFKEAVNYGAGDYPNSVFCANLDGDGDLDLAVANYNSDNVSILKNLTQIPANQPPWAFHLISPGPTDTTQVFANFAWRIPYDPNFGDQIRYDLYISTTPGFEPQNTIVDSNLTVSHQTENLDLGTYYWKVKAKDNWGAYSWSQVTFQFFNSTYISDTLTVIAFSPVDLIVTDPKGDSIGLGFNTIPYAFYDTTSDWNEDSDLDDIITIPNRLVGNYSIRVVAEPVVEKATYSLGIRIDGGNLALLASGHTSPPPGESDAYQYHAPWYLRGDANKNWTIELGDVVYLISYLYKSGPAPDLLESGDVNCSGVVELGDIVYLITYLYKGGPPPGC